MDVFLTIRRQKTTIFTDAKESTTVLELKKIIGGILKVSPEDQMLYKEDQQLDDNKSLADSGFTSQTAKAQTPGILGLAVREGDAFENLTIEPYSSPPELPDVMKTHDGIADQKK
uniref:elongin-B-like n=1 Tax=Styela clava TaxID=7725 RepID=UPI00193A2265|nr:elongin-B-like [Styela clava]